MPKGVYAAASAMVTEQRALDVTSYNMANAQSVGFRRAEALRSSFATELAMQQQRTDDISGNGGAGVLADGVFRAQAQGNIHRSDRPTDIAISGEGFFHLIDDQGGVALSRDGAFDINENGELINDLGWKLQGQGGDIQLPPDRMGISIDEAGRIYAQFADGAGVAPVFRRPDTHEPG